MPDSCSPKLKKRNISGVLLLNKPSGITSNRALQVSKRLFSAMKSGHTGTLDPMATGLLPICFGEATKFSSALLGAGKTYQATLKLGYNSTTGDAEGVISAPAIIKTNITRLTISELKIKLQCFVGKILQIPPMYSALKHQGKPLYTYARKGQEIERKPREVYIYSLNVTSFVEDVLQITVKCSAGTYIRTLAEDIGKALDYGGAYLTKLCRCSAGNYDLSQAQTLDFLESIQLVERDGYLRPIDSLLSNFSPIELNAEATVNLMYGRALLNQAAVIDFPAGDCVRLYDNKKRFLGLGEIQQAGKIIPRRLMVSC